MKLNPVLLCIETSNEICSVVLACGEEIISIRESDEKNSHAKNLNVFVEEIFQEAKMDIKETDAVVVSSGPGSYTGLRIGVSSAKGFCSVLNAPLIAVKTLDAMLSIFDENTFRYALIHARENEFYCSAINEDNQKIYDDNIFFSSEIK